MKLWLIYNYSDYKRNKEFADMIYSKCNKFGISLELLFVENIFFGIKNNNLYLEYSNNPVDLPDAVIMRTIHPLLSKHLEMMGADVYNNSLIADICNDKAKTYQYVSQCNMNIIPGLFVKSNYIDYYENNHYFHENCVIKSVDGHGGKEVNLYNKNTIITKNKDVVAQSLIEGKGQDIRVYVLNNQIIAGVLRTSNSGFKSNFSLGGDAALYNIDNTLNSYVMQIIELFKEETKNIKVNGLSFAGIDFLLDKDGQYYFNEIEDVVGSRMLYSSSNIDIVDLWIDFIYNN